MSNVLTNIESKKPAATVTKPDNTSNVENLDDFPIDDMDSILPSIENFEEIPIAQQPSKPNEPVANNTSHAMCTLNRSLGAFNIC
jgi:Mg/Co/Ni transporter MgtE